MRRRYWLGAICLLLLTIITEVGLSTRQESTSWDEGDHIYAGYMNWKHGEYDLNPEHPPLVKSVATLPLLPLNLRTAPREGRNFKDESYYGGHYTTDTLLFRVHMTVLVFGLVLALLVFAATREMFGATAGLIAIALYVLDPTVLANAPFVATDTGAACGFFAAVCTFYRFTQQMRWTRAVVCGVACGLALAAKFSTVLLLPLLLLLTVGDIAMQWRTNRSSLAQHARRLVPGMAISTTSTVWARPQ